MGLPVKLIVSLSIVGILLAGCAVLQPPNARARALLAAKHFEMLSPAGYTLAAVAQHGSDVQWLTVFTEGDGASWPQPSVHPRDPTPGRPLGLYLALAHYEQVASSAEAVAYLGRPCQYLDEETLRTCPPAWWTLGRFGTVPLALMNARLDELKALAPNAKLRLVGYSGGGAMAALLASRRSDVACLVTVAAPLDTDAWTRAKNVSLLSQSSNPLDAAAALRGLPMTHFSGGSDDVVPPGVNQLFLDQAQTRERLQSGFDHDTQWLKAWPSLAAESCLAN